MILVIKGRLPTLNHVINSSKRHWAHYKKIKESATGLCSASAIDQLGRVQIENPITIECEWYWPDRRTDPDNIAHGIKYVLDGLVVAGVIQNDNWKQIHSIGHTFAIGDPQVVVTIEEVDQ